jgi:hypothetical protein
MLPSESMLGDIAQQYAQVYTPKERERFVGINLPSLLPNSSVVSKRAERSRAEGEGISSRVSHLATRQRPQSPRFKLGHYRDLVKYPHANTWLYGRAF